VTISLRVNVAVRLPLLARLSRSPVHVHVSPTAASLPGSVAQKP
jgi:hypothetical protein